MLFRQPQRETHLTKTQQPVTFKMQTFRTGITNQQATRTRFCSGAANCWAAFDNATHALTIKCILRKLVLQFNSVSCNLVNKTAED